MTRPTTALAVAALALSTLSTDAHARTTCVQDGNGQLCTSEVDFETFAQEAYESQEQSQWCWAASISMLFSFYGHPVEQDRIVTEVYGSAVNMPAAYGQVIAEQLNRSWDDDNGARFTSTLTGAYDSQAGINTLTNQTIVNELDQDRPLIIGARTHAMVLTAVQYYVTPQGPYVVGAGVFDPWPGNGARALEPDEFVADMNGGSLRFLATARVTEGGAEPPPPPGNPRPWACACSASSGADGALLALLGAALVGRRRMISPPRARWQ